jgi:hypothetical protein
MYLWQEGDLNKINDYIKSYYLHSKQYFYPVLQAVKELSIQSERSILES